MTTKGGNLNYSAPHGKYNASMMTGKTAASTNYQDGVSYDGGLTNLSPSKSGSPTKSGKQGSLRPSSSSPTKNKRLQMAQRTKASIDKGQMNISPNVQVRASVEIGGKGGEANNMFYNAALMDKISAK